jgi:hypothetical protein
VAVAQYTFTHKQYTEYRERNIIIIIYITIKKLNIHNNPKKLTNLGSADRAPSLRVIPWHLLYN